MLINILPDSCNYISENYIIPANQSYSEASRKKDPEKEFNKNLENSIRENVGNLYGDFTIEPIITNSLCLFKIKFEKNLTDDEARKAGTLVVRTLLDNYGTTNKIVRILEGFMEVSTWVYSLKPMPAGELRGPTKKEVYMGMAIYRWKTDRIDWTHKWFR